MRVFRSTITESHVQVNGVTVSTEILVGLLLGILIGVMSGVVALILIRTMAEATIQNLSSLVTITGEFFAIPLFMFGGQWAAGLWLQEQQLSNMLLPYVFTLTVLFVGIVSLPIYRLTLRLAAEMGESIGPSHD